MTASTDLRVGLCTIAKDQGAYLEEWVAYHHLQGYDPIRVYAHECSDNSHAVLARLAKYGMCEWETFVSPAIGKAHSTAYRHGLERLRARTDWVAFVDLDEFLVTPAHMGIGPFLADHGHLGAIAVNRKTFARVDDRERAFLIERSTRCAEQDYPPNRAIRMLVRTDVIEAPRAHTAQFSPGTAYQTVLGEAIGEYAVTSDRVSHDLIRLNHYSDKPEDRRHSQKTDTDIHRWLKPMKTLVADLRDIDLDDVYADLDGARRRIRRLETEAARLADQLRFATSRGASLQTALQAETRRSESLEQEVQVVREHLARIADSTSWRVGSRAVRVARMATLRRAGGDSPLDLAARGAAPSPPPDEG